MKVEELRQAVTADNMIGVFTVPSMMCKDPMGTHDYVPAVGSLLIDMFNLIEMVELEHIMQWSAYITATGEHYLAENML